MFVQRGTSGVVFSWAYNDGVLQGIPGGTAGVPVRAGLLLPPDDVDANPCQSSTPIRIRTRGYTCRSGKVKTM